MKKKNLLSGILVAILMSFTMGIQAQTVNVNPEKNIKPVTDQELETLVTITQKLQPLQMQSQSAMMKAIKNSGLSMQRYREITSAKRQGKNIQMTKKEEKAFSSIAQTMQREQKKIQNKLNTLLQKHSISQQRFKQINRKLQNDKELQNRFKKMQQKKMQQKQQ